MSTSQHSKTVGHASISKTENAKMSKSQHARFVKWKAPTNEECSDADFVCHSSDAVRERRHTFNHHVLLSLIGAFHFTLSRFRIPGTNFPHRVGQKHKSFEDSWMHILKKNKELIWIRNKWDVRARGDVRARKECKAKLYEQNIEIGVAGDFACCLLRAGVCLAQRRVLC